MQLLLLHPTALALWYAQLNEAQHSTSIHLQSEIESYLVFLLMRYTQDCSLANSVLGLEFLKGTQLLADPHSHHLLKDVGDKCLLTAGLFPECAKRKQVQQSYFINLGQTAYSTFSHYAAREENLFNQLCHEFPKMTGVLRGMRQSSIIPLEALCHYSFDKSSKKQH